LQKSGASGTSRVRGPLQAVWWGAELGYYGTGCNQAVYASSSAAVDTIFSEFEARFKSQDYLIPKFIKKAGTRLILETCEFVGK